MASYFVRIISWCANLQPLGHFSILDGTFGFCFQSEEVENMKQIDLEKGSG